MVLTYHEWIPDGWRLATVEEVKNTRGFKHAAIDAMKSVETKFGIFCLDNDMTVSNRTKHLHK